MSGAKGPEGKGKGKTCYLGLGSDGFWTLWVGNLPHGYDDKSIDALFKDVGGGRTKKNYLGGACGSSSSDQWAKIFFDTRAEAEQAMEKYDGVQVQWPPGQEDSRFHKLKVTWFDYDKAEETRWALTFFDMPFVAKMEVTRKYVHYGITGKRFSEEKGWTRDHPKIPGYVKHMVWQGTGHKFESNQFHDMFNKFYYEQELESKGKSKGKDKYYRRGKQDGN